MHDQKISRRKVLKAGAAAAAAFTIVPRHVLGQGCLAPSDTLTRAIIGTGAQAGGHTGIHSENPILALADCDADHLSGFNASGDEYTDWRDVIARDDIDYVHIVTPPHWHALMVIAAAEAGKDIFCEKPFTRTIGEGIAAVDACRRNGTILRINTWGRATPNHSYGALGGMRCHDLKKLVEDGRLGTPLTVNIRDSFTSDGIKVNQSHTVGHTDDMPQSVPSQLDYNMWLGPRPWKPYKSHRVHWNFRAYWDYDAGGMGDMGFHYFDPVQYFLGKDNESPVEIIPAESNQEQHPDACLPWNRVEARYADGTTVVFDAENVEENVLVGPNGWVKPNWDSSFGNLQTEFSGSEFNPGNTDFIQCIRNREKFCLNEEVAHHTCTLMNLCTIAIRLGRRIEWDPENNQVIGDDQANRLVWEAMRAPWHMNGAEV
jgi:predicted dehydrogenase